MKLSLRDSGNVVIACYSCEPLASGGTNPVWPDSQANRCALNYKVPSARKQLTLLVECFDKETLRSDDVIGVGVLDVLEFVGASVVAREVTVKLLSEDGKKSPCGDVVLEVGSVVLDATATVDTAVERSKGKLQVTLLQVPCRVRCSHTVSAMAAKVCPPAHVHARVYCVVPPLLLVVSRVLSCTTHGWWASRARSSRSASSTPVGCPSLMAAPARWPRVASSLSGTPPRRRSSLCPTRCACGC